MTLFTYKSMFINLLLFVYLRVYPRMLTTGTFGNINIFSYIMGTIQNEL